MLKGAQRYANIRNRWELITIANCENIHSVKKLLKFWKPDGCIADCGDFLCKLPVPSAVFAANDRMAHEVIAAAHAIWMSVPDDIAVVGIDNNEMIALSTNPSLTTVEVDFEKAGFSAGELLDSMLSDPSSKHARRFFGALRLIRRGSTAVNKKRDPTVNAAQEYILRHCTDSISVKDVAAMFPCSRRMAEVRFRAATGHAIGEEIREARMNIVKGYLTSSTTNLDAIANMSGWKSSAVLRQYFKRKTGLTLSAWRKAQRNGKAKPMPISET